MRGLSMEMILKLLKKKRREEERKKRAASAGELRDIPKVDIDIDSFPLPEDFRQGGKHDKPSASKKSKRDIFKTPKFKDIDIDSFPLPEDFYPEGVRKKRRKPKKKR